MARDIGDDPAIGIDYRRNASGSRAYDRQAFFDRTHPCLRQMFDRPPIAEPRIVRRVEQEIGAVRLVHDLAGKDDFIADLQADIPKAPNRNRFRPRPRDEIDVARYQTRQPKRCDRLGGPFIDQLIGPAEF